MSLPTILRYSTVLKTYADNACCVGYWQFMMLTLSTFVKERFSMFTQTCMSVLGLYETRDSLDVENFELDLDERKP